MEVIFIAKKLFRGFLILILICLGCACAHKEVPIPDESLLHGAVYLNPPFNGQRPCLYMNGKIYYWYGVAHPYEGGVGTFRLEDYTEAETIEVVGEAPDEDGEFWGPAMSGSVYISSQTPEAVYVRVSSESIEGWEDGNYVRMITAVLLRDGANQIYLYGKRYSLFQTGDLIMDTLPDGYEVIGQAIYIGMDLVPEDDLETNSKHGQYGNLLDGSDVYYNAESPEMIFIPAVEMNGEISYYGIPLACEENTEQ